MESMFSVQTASNSELYHFLLLESKCSAQRSKCIRNCETCPFHTGEQKAEKLFRQLIGIVKSRSPELYFADDLTELSKILRGNTE